MEESSSRNQLVKTDSVVTQQSEIDLQQMSEAVFGTHSPIKVSTAMKTGLGGNDTEKKSSMRKWYTLTGFLHEVYIPMLRQPAAKVRFLLFFQNCKFRRQFCCFAWPCSSLVVLAFIAQKLDLNWPMCCLRTQHRQLS